MKNILTQLGILLSFLSCFPASSDLATLKAPLHFRFPISSASNLEVINSIASVTAHGSVENNTWFVFRGNAEEVIPLIQQENKWDNPKKIQPSKGSNTYYWQWLVSKDGSSTTINIYPSKPAHVPGKHFYLLPRVWIEIQEVNEPPPCPPCEDGQNITGCSC